MQLEKESVLAAMFFPKGQRQSFRMIVDAARAFNAQVSLCLSQNLDSVAKISKCDDARLEFNKLYDAAMESLTDTLYSGIYKEWSMHSKPRRKSILSSNKSRCRLSH